MKKKKKLLDNKPSRLSKFWTKNRVEINGVSHGVYVTGSQIRFDAKFRFMWL